MDRWSFLRTFSIGRILDVGCNDGKTWLEADFPTNVVGVENFQFAWQPKAGFTPDGKQVIQDIPAWREREIRKIKEIWKWSHRPFVVADGFHLPFKSEQFDTVVLAEILEHVERPLGLIKEASRVLRKGGRVVITVPDEYSWPKELKPFTHSGHIHCFHEEDVRELAKQSGLRLRLFYHSLPEWSEGFVFWYVVLQK